MFLFGKLDFVNVDFSRIYGIFSVCFLWEVVGKIGGSKLLKKSKFLVCSYFVNMVFWAILCSIFTTSAGYIIIVIS